MNLSEAKTATIQALRKAAFSHQAGDFAAVRACYDELDETLPRTFEAEGEGIYCGLRFLEAWADASNHEWRYYEPTTKADWPTMANRLAIAIEQNESMQVLSSLAQFTNRTS